VEGLHPFDDVSVEYFDENSRKSHIFLQLKSKATKRLTMEKLLAEKGPFSLRKFYESYIQNEEKFNCSEEGVKLEGRIDGSLFILYTNADVEQKLKSYNVIDFSQEEFLMTGGNVLQFNEEEHKAIYEHLQERKEEDQKAICKHLQELNEKYHKDICEHLQELNEKYHKAIYEHLQELNEEDHKAICKHLQELNEKYHKAICKHLQERNEKYHKAICEHLQELNEEDHKPICKHLQEPNEEDQKAICKHLQALNEKYHKAIYENLQELNEKYHKAIYGHLQELIKDDHNAICKNLQELYKNYHKAICKHLRELNKKYHKAICKHLQELYEKYHKAICKNLQELKEKYHNAIFKHQQELNEKYHNAIFKHQQELNEKYHKALSKHLQEPNEEDHKAISKHLQEPNEEEHKTNSEHLQEPPKYREFLSRFRILYNQTNEKEMDSHIKRELQQIMHLPESELDITYMCFLDIVKNWWQHEHFFLKDTNSRENDPLQKTSEKVKPLLVAKMKQRNSELDELSIKFKQSAIRDVEKLIEPQKAVLIFVPGSSTTLTAAKIHQMLSNTEHIILNLKQLIRYKTEVMFAWKSMFDVLVLESDRSADVSPHLFSELSGFLNDNVAKKKFIFISNSVDNIQQIHELRNTFRANLTEKYDDCKFTDIVTESQMLFLNKNVSFQGREVKLSTIVKNDDVYLLNAIECNSISLLLENEKPSIGMSTEDTVKYYIDRTLQCRKQANTRFPVQGKIQDASSGDILQDVQDSRPHFEENMGKGSAPGWKASTLLDGDGQIILVTNEPGMGKSTLLTHLAQQTREHHPDMWIVRVNINNYTRILQEMKENGCDENGVIKMLTEAAQIKKSENVFLEGRLFNYTYSSTGNMVVLIDGADEVSPHYTEEVIQVLKLLSKTKIKRIWVTSRNPVGDCLETEFQCPSYLLVPFSGEDQENFLMKFWKETCPEMEDVYLEKFAKRVVELSKEHLTVQDKEFMGIPLQSWLLAEMFKGDLKKYSVSENVELPEHINILMLYDLYVEKKWDIYLSDKKLSDITNVNVQNDEEELHKSFLHNHMAAAMVAILSTQQLEKLTDKTIAESARVFLQKITAGLEKTGIIIDVKEGRPVFQHRTVAEYLAAMWLCDNFQSNQTFMRDHLFESGFLAVRRFVDRILADKCTLHEAVLNSSLNEVEKLLRNEISEEDLGGRTPLHVAVSCSNPELIKLLLEHGADVRSVDTLLDLSPVEYAVRMGKWDMVNLLTEKRPEIWKETLTNQLHQASESGNLQTVYKILTFGISVETINNNGYTPLHISASCGHKELSLMLLDFGANVNVKDKHGRTPLHLSAGKGHVDVVRELLKHGARVNIPDQYGATPLQTASQRGHMQVVRELQNHGAKVDI